MKRKRDSIGFSHAWEGLMWACKQQLNLQIHVVTAVAVICIGLLLHLSLTEWLFIASAIALVFMCELFNTAVEQLGNAITNDFNEHIKRAKDVSASAVLVSAIFAVVIGLVIFIPHFL